MFYCFSWIQINFRTSSFFDPRPHYFPFVQARWVEWAVWQKHRKTMDEKTFNQKYADLIFYSIIFQKIRWKTLILLIPKNMIFIIVWILLQKRKNMFFEISKIKLFLQHFLNNNAVENRISSLLMKFSWCCHYINLSHRPAVG